MLRARVIDIKHLSKSYDLKPVLDNVSLCRWAFCWASSAPMARKTTLISILTGLTAGFGEVPSADST